MTLTLIEIFTIIIIHWIADFILQDEKWALGKSKNWKDLLSHTYLYGMCWFVVGAYLQALNEGIFFPQWHVTFFFLITFVCHTITDYFTSRIVSKKFANKEYGSSIPNMGAFTIIGFDQVLHHIQLFLTYYLLK